MSSELGKVKIIIIEDNPGDAFIIMGLLQDLDMSLDIALAKDGEEAIRLLTKASTNGPPDLVILDLNLPKIDGFDLLRLIKLSPGLSNVPVVVMTGSLNPDDETRSRALGATDFCIKPASNDEMNSTLLCLRNHLETVCHNKRMHCDPKGSNEVQVGIPSRHGMSGPSMLSHGRQLRSNDHLDPPSH